MTISALAAPTVAAQETAARKPGGTLGKEEFLQLLVAQLKNQDPMNPSNPEEMAAQLAQFSSVEQLININEALTNQAASNAVMAEALNNASAVSVLGKTVLTIGDQVDIDGTGTETVVAGVEGDGGVATVHLYDADGTKVGSHVVGTIGGGRQEIELGELSEGLEPGRYTYELTVTDADGEAVNVQTFMRAAVDGLRYGPQGPMLVSGGLEIPLANVVEIISQRDNPEEGEATP